MKHDKETSSQPLRSPREVSSRFLSPTSTPTHDSGIRSPNKASSPMRRKSGENSRKHRSLEDPSFTRGLWPSALAGLTPSSQPYNKKLGTLADHLGNERFQDFLGQKSGKNAELSLGRQRNHTEISRFEKDLNASKENHRPGVGGSMRYTGKLPFPGTKSTSSDLHTPANSGAVVLPGRFSFDENALYRKSSRRKSDSFLDGKDSEDSECSDVSSSASSSSLSLPSRRAGIVVPSKYMNDATSRHRRGISDSNTSNPVSLNESGKSNKSLIKSVIKRAGSLNGYGGVMSQWALSPGRTGSPPMSVESKEKIPSFSSMKPPSSPSRPKGVEKLLNMGLDLFKSKKSPSRSPAVGSGGVESVHRFRLLHNRLLQWQYVNARADFVHQRMSNEAKRNLIFAWSSLTKLRHSVVQRKIQLEKEKLTMKLNFILHCQIKPLENWGDMETQHLSYISKTTECLYSIICRVPVEGVEVNLEETSYVLRYASDLTTTVKSNLISFLPSVTESVPLLSELAKVVRQERLLLEECFEHLRNIPKLQIQERSLMCSVLQLNSLQAATAT